MFKVAWLTILLHGTRSLRKAEHVVWTGGSVEGEGKHAEIWSGLVK